jgi:hypothetical protein
MTDTNYNGTQMLEIMDDAEKAIRIVDHDMMVQWHTARDTDTAIAIDEKREARRWITREIQRYKMHDVIRATVMLARPYDWHQMLLEWPHVSQGDKSKIAYTQNEVKGQRDIQTVTSVGKYLNRHFDLPDHIIRDLVSRYGTASQFKLVHTTAEMIYHLHRGPQSCMVWGEDRGVRCADGVTRHPYETYDPKFGWHMAVRVEGDATMGRALCMTKPDGHKYFVRSYLRPSNTSSYSQTDDGMENWLQEQSYSKHSSWDDGEKLAYHPAQDNFVAPYLDGGEKRVTINAGAGAIVVDSDGEYACDQTGGCPTYEDEDENSFECACCGDNTDDDDGYWVERGEDVRVCESCLNHEYQYVYGRRGNQYHVHENNAVYVESNSEHYDEDYLNDNNIVQLENGEYEQMEEAIEINGDWYSIDDDRICRFEDTDEYGLTEDGWQCVTSCNWYTDDCTDWVEIKGERYHKDNAPETDDAEEDGDTKPDATLLTMEMLWNTHMVWDYTIAMDMVTVSLTYTHDGHTLHTERTFSTEFVNSVDRAEFNRTLRNQLCTALIEQAYNNSLATI